MTGAPRAPLSQPTTFFVGWEKELALLRGRLAEAGGSQGRLVLVSGESGIGKVELCSVNASQASADPGHLQYFNPDLDVARTAREFLSQFSLPQE